MLKVLVTVVLVAGVSPFLEGFMRKVRALLHSRQGPPIYQPYLDIVKLLGKERLQPYDSILFRFPPLMCFGAVLTASLFVPYGYSPALEHAGDIIVFIYMITLSSVAVFLGGLASASPYGSIGSSRELMILFTVEPILAITMVVAGFKAQSMLISEIPVHAFSISMTISALGFLLAMQAQIAKLPFDIIEAEQEIMDGPFIEYSGPDLALFKWSFYMKQFIFASLFWRVFVNWPNFHTLEMPYIVASCLNIVANFAEVLLLMLLVAIIDVVNPRLRIDQSLRYFATIIFLVMCGLAFAFIGS